MIENDRGHAFPGEHVVRMQQALHRMQRPMKIRADADAVGVERQAIPSKVHPAVEVDRRRLRCCRSSPELPATRLHRNSTTSNLLDALRAELNHIVDSIAAARNENVHQHECLVRHVDSIMELQRDRFDHHERGLANMVREQHEMLASSLEAKIGKLQAPTEAPTSEQFAGVPEKTFADSCILDEQLYNLEDLWDAQRSLTPLTLTSSTPSDRIEERLQKINSRTVRLNKHWIMMDKSIKGLPLKDPSSRFVQFIESNVFAVVCSIAIVANTIIIGIQADTAIKNLLAIPRRDDPSWMRHTNLFFTLLFSVELALRLMALRCSYFTDVGWLWNVIDAILVILGLVEELVQEVGNATFLRAVRIIKVTRAVRIFRVFRFFLELRLMLISVIASLTALSWAFLLLLILLYWFAIVFTQGVCIYLNDNATDEQTLLSIKEWYSSVPQAMLTLLLAISGGNDWHQLAQPLISMSLGYFILFIVYIFFVVFGLLNVLTGIFCERAQHIGKLGKDLVVLSETEKTDEFYIDMTRIFNEASSDGNGSITWDEFKKYLKREDVQAYFATLELRNTDARELFKLLDRHNIGSVNVAEFIFGCMKVSGSAKSFDLLRVESKISKVDMKVSEICNRLKGNSARRVT